MKRKKKSNKKIDIVTPWITIFAAATLIIAAISFFRDEVVFICAISVAVLSLAVVAVGIFNMRHYSAKIISDALKSAVTESKEFMDSICVPAAVIDLNGEIIAVNELFIKTLCETDDKNNVVNIPIGSSIENYLSEKNVNALYSPKGADTLCNKSWYIAFAVKKGEGSLVYFINDNTYKVNSDEYLLSKPAIAIVSFDNREELERDAEEGEASRITVLVEKEIVKWAASTTGFYKKINAGKYLVVVEERYIKRFIDEKFKILDEIRAIKIDDRMNATISIGVGHGGATFKENEFWARQALDMALGRGGDQAAVKKAETYKFFGGASKGIEKRDKVRTRVISATLTEHINNSSNVLIMGHRFSDLDSVGAAIGMWSAVVKGLHHNAYIVIDRQQTLARPLVASFEKSGFESIFKTEDEALDLIDDHTILIIVDTHSPNFLESKDVYLRCKRVVVIDHHRMMVNHIDNALVFYHEPYASSASEMVAELIQYMGKNTLSRLESEALMSGIMLDTKNFVLRTGVRTFEAAAYLKSNGADTVEVKRLFSNSIDTYKVKYKLVSEAEIFNYCAIAVADESTPDIRIASAQAADELLGIENVKASFVMYRSGRTVNISARSLGDLNVQVIMEALGGGGHQTMAACQLNDISLEAAREKLISIINDLKINQKANQTAELK